MTETTDSTGGTDTTVLDDVATRVEPAVPREPSDPGDLGASTSPSASGQPTEPPAEPTIGTSLGRYVVLEVIGRGSMGRVLRAYDPKLQREVALKLVTSRALDSDARDRMLQEARAMAQLSHPNVVAVYDAEESRAGIMLVMEYVAGSNLRRWRQGSERSWAHVVNHYVRAGRGLAAAHAAGLLHRDFKPANVLVAESGVVKVTDFGLAKLASMPSTSEGHPSLDSLSSAPLDGALTRAGTVMGTPRYMSPEQHTGAPLDPRTDQYAFCVALWEALVGRPPHEAKDMERLFALKHESAPAWPSDGPSVPRTVVEALRRGLAAQADDRWPDMDALLARLSIQPADRRSQLLALSGLGLVAAVALVGQSWATRGAPRCTGASDHLEQIWGSTRRETVQQALVAIEAPYVERAWEHSAAALDDYADAWIAMHTETCEATTVRGDQTSEVMDLRMACLHRAKIELAAVTDVLASADAVVARNAFDLTDGLMPLSRCADVEALLAEVEPPDPEQADAVEAIRQSLADADAERKAGRYARARQAVTRARELLATTDYGPIRTEVVLVDGELCDLQGKYEDSVTALREALESASRWGQRELMRRAARRLMFVVGYQQRRMDEGLRYWELAYGLAGGDPSREASARSSKASVLGAQGRYDEAAAEHRRALELRQSASGADSLDVGASTNNLAAALYMKGEYAESEALHRRSIELHTRVMGPDHPDVAAAHNNLAVALQAQGKLDEALEEHRRGLAGRQAALGPDHPDVGVSHNNLAAVLYQMGQHEEAEAHFRRALAIREQSLGPEHVQVGEALSNLANVLVAQGRIEEAEDMQRRGLDIMSKTLGPKHPTLAAIRGNLGNFLRRRGDYAGAEAEHRDALAVQLEALGPEHPYTLVSRSNIAADLKAQGRLEQAEAEYRQVIEHRERSLDDDHPELAESRRNLAEVLLASGALDEAKTLAEAAWRRHQRDDIPASERAASAFVLAQVRWASGDEDSAREHAQQARRAFAAEGEPHASDLAQVDAWLAEHGGASAP